MRVLEKLIRFSRLYGSACVIKNVGARPFLVPRCGGCAFGSQCRFISSTTVCPAVEMKIYTGRGDKGKSSTFTGQRLPKDHPIFQALGAVDELSSWLGVCRELATEKRHPYVDSLLRIQCILQDVMSLVATPKKHVKTEKQTKIHTILDESVVEELETWIDDMTAQLPALKNFVLPGGSNCSAYLHVARSVCRRAERNVVPLLSSDDLDPICAKYLNRLSDYLFTVARYACHLEGKEETVYTKP